MNQSGQQNKAEQQQEEVNVDSKEKNINIFFQGDDYQIHSSRPAPPFNLHGLQQTEQSEHLQTQPEQYENDCMSDHIVTVNQYGQRKRFSMLTEVEEFGKYSLGLHIFFDQLKELIKIFFILTLISIPSLYVNYCGRSIENISSANQLSFFLLKFTPANQPIANIQTYQASASSSSISGIESGNQTIISSFLALIAQNKTWLVVPDICSCVVLLVLSLRLYKRQKKIGKKRNKRNLILTTSDYSLEVSGFPSNTKNSEELKIFFSQFGEIKQCYLGRTYRGLLAYFLKQYHLIEIIKYLKEKLSNQKSKSPQMQSEESKIQKQFKNSAQNEEQKCDDNLQLKGVKKQEVKDEEQNKEEESLRKKIYKKKNELKKLERKIKFLRNTQIGYDYYHDDYPSIVCFITFDTLDSRHNCLHAFKEYNSCLKRKKCPENLKFRGIYQLQINQYVSEPSNIMWENLGILKLEKLFRKIIIGLITLAIIFALICLAFILNYFIFSVQSAPNCNRNRFYTYQEAASSSKLQACFCHQYEFDTIYENLQIQSMCVSYLTTFSNMNYKSIIIGCETLLINYISEFLIVQLRSFFKFTSHTEQSNTLAIFIFIATSINIFIQLHLSAYGFNIWSSLGKLLFIEQTNLNASNLLRSVQNIIDYNRAWSFTIGLNIQYSFLMCIVLPHTTSLILEMIIKQVKRSKNYQCKNPLPKSVKEIFKLDFTIYKFQAVILNTIFFTYVFQANAPLLLLFTFISLVVQFWVYKFTIIKISKKPPQFDYRLGNLTIKIIPLSIILHLFVSIIAYTNYNIFPSIERQPTYDLQAAYQFDQDNGNAEQISLNTTVLGDRLVDMKFFIILMLLMIVGLFCQNCIKHTMHKFSEYIRSRRGSKPRVLPIQSNSQNEKTFSQYLSNVLDGTLTTYDITKNPKYAQVIKLLDDKRDYSKSSIDVQKPYSKQFEMNNEPATESHKVSHSFKNNDKSKENAKENNFEVFTKTSDNTYNGFRVQSPNVAQSNLKTSFERRSNRLGTPFPDRNQMTKKKKEFNQNRDTNHIINSNLQVLTNKQLNNPITTEEPEDLEISECKETDHYSEENEKQDYQSPQKNPFQ